MIVIGGVDYLLPCLIRFSGVALVFIFSWLLMIAVVVLFVSGGATYTEVCHPLMRTSPSSCVIRVSAISLCLLPASLKQKN